MNIGHGSSVCEDWGNGATTTSGHSGRASRNTSLSSATRRGHRSGSWQRLSGLPTNLLWEDVSLSPEGHEPDLSIAVFPEFRGLGYGSEAYALAVRYIFENLALDHLVAGSREDNAASIRMLEKASFVRRAEKDEVYDNKFGPGKVKWLAFNLPRANWRARNTQ